MPALPLDEHYLRWLYSRVAPVLEQNKRRTYWEVARGMYSREYIWFIPNDDNRLEDGLLLRYDFIAEEELDADREWLELGCSFFEMFVALIQRLSFEDGRSKNVWFLELLRNLQLDEFPDARPPFREDLDNILDTVIWRTYDYNGLGGLFPLGRPTQDQKVTEIWYQLSAYLNENGQ